MALKIEFPKYGGATVPYKVKPRGAKFAHAELLLVHGCRGLIQVPPDAQPQTLTVFTAASEHGDSDLPPLVDADGKVVTLRVEPGRSYVLPAAMFDCSLVRLQGEFEFDAMLILRGENYMRGCGARPCEVRFFVPHLPALRKKNPGFDVRGLTRGQLHVPLQVRKPRPYTRQDLPPEPPIPLVESQVVTVLVAGTDSDSFLPLFDANGKPVTFRVEPGHAHSLPRAVFEYGNFVWFQSAGADKDFDAHVVT